MYPNGGRNKHDIIIDRLGCSIIRCLIRDFVVFDVRLQKTFYTLEINETRDGRMLRARARACVYEREQLTNRNNKLSA